MCLSLCVLWYNTDPEVCFAIFAESELMKKEMLQRIEERRKKSPPVASSLPSPPPPPETETMKKPSSILSKPLAAVGGEDTVLQQDIAKQSNSQQPGQQSPVEAGEYDVAKALNSVEGVGGACLESFSCVSGKPKNPLTLL
ncbi:hypothetical protein CY35_03G053400 [Sphagnum magellanicum]|nr:hypothetical protein CY35_03G053400 [Sphagnum magellanicum]